MSLLFRPFELADKEQIDSFLKPYQFSCSEFTFTNLIIWGQDKKIQWAEQDDTLYILLRFGMHAPFMFPPISKRKNQDFRAAVQIALEYFNDIGAAPMFRSVCGPFVSLFYENFPQFALAADRNTFDYVYRTEDLIALSGRKYHAKRNHIHQFNSQYQYVYKPLTPDMADECLALLISWLGDKNVNEPGILGEMRAIQFLLPNMERLGVLGGCIYIHDKLSAFTIGERLNDDMAVIHIEKADSEYPGLYALINQQYAAHTWENITYINREEDMGVPGMRKAKLSYHPAFLTEKYNALLLP